MDKYKVEILEKMLEANEAISGGYGAHLSMEWADLKPISLDSGALRVLIDYYKKGDRK